MSAIVSGSGAYAVAWAKKWKQNDEANRWLLLALTAWLPAAISLLVLAIVELPILRALIANALSLPSLVIGVRLWLREFRLLRKKQAARSTATAHRP